MRALIDYYNYAGFDTPLTTIEKDKSYMGTLPENVFRDLFSEFMAILDQ